VEGKRKLVDRWTKCIEKEGDYVGKWRTCFSPYFGKTKVRIICYFRS
jgi:hypothetical protein